MATDPSGRYVVNVDPFADGTPSGQGRIDIENDREGSQRTFPGTYVTPLRAMQGGQQGVNTDIIRESAVNGYDPNAPAPVGTQVNIVNEQGEGFGVDLRQVNPQTLQQAMQQAVQGGATNYQDAAVEAFRAESARQQNGTPAPVNRPMTTRPTVDRSAPLAGLNSYVVPESTVGGGQLIPQQPVYQPQQDQAAEQAMDQRLAAQQAVGAPINGMPGRHPSQDMNRQPQINPLSAFRAQEQPTSPMADEPFRPIDIGSNLQPMTPDTHPPQFTVNFEIEGFGTHEAPYHQVIRSEQALVLVYDTRYTGGQKYFPQTDRPLGVHVHGTDSMYLVHTTNIQFPLDYWEVCVLLIENEAPVDTGELMVPPNMPEMGQMP
jgi:hypothetical protein